MEECPGAGCLPVGDIVEDTGIHQKVAGPGGIEVLPDLLRALRPPSAGTGFKSDTHYCVTILAIYGCIIDRYDFKQQTLITSVPVGQESGHGLAGCSTWSLMRLQSRCQPGLGAHLEAGLGSRCPHWHGCWPHSDLHPCGGSAGSSGGCAGSQESWPRP